MHLGGPAPVKLALLIALVGLGLAVAAVIAWRLDREDRQPLANFPEDWRGWRTGW